MERAGAGRLLCRAGLAALLALPVSAQEDPQQSDVQEEVRVDLVQLEVSVWPKQAGDAGACLGLTPEDFTVVVNGRERRIAAVDWLGSAEAIEVVDGVPVADPEHPPLTMVILFDLWHLDLFHRDFDCPITKPMAFDGARRLVREEFREGDRLLLATLSGWPQIHEGWIRDPEHALWAIDRLEVSPFVLSGRTNHLHHEDWFEGLKTLILALGKYPGRKEVFYMADDFRFDDLSMRVFALAARAQSNQVSIHAVDLLASCRNVPGPGCTSTGGLGCTDFRHPIALGYISKNTGGELSNSDALVDAVRRVRQLRSCRYMISFEAKTRDAKRAPKATVRLTRKGLQVNYPSSFGHTGREPKEREHQDALSLLPRFGNGLYAEVGLWPLRPHDRKKNSWRGLAIARLSRAVGDEWPPGVTRLEVEAVVHKESRILGKYSVVIEDEELVDLRDRGKSRLFVFPVERIRPGSVTVAMRVIGVGGDVSANVRGMVSVPKPPGPGESGAWFLTHRMARAGEAITLIPALDGSLEQGQQALLVGYGCRGEGGLGVGRLRALSGERQVRVTLDWLNADEIEYAGTRECGWLAGQVGESLEPGLWRFEPPAGPDEDPAVQSMVEFRVVPTSEAGSSR